MQPLQIEVQEGIDRQGRGDTTTRTIPVLESLPTGREKQRHVLIFVSGMHTNADWVGRVKKTVEKYSIDEIICEKVQTGLLGPFRLITRIGLRKARSEIKDQISNIIISSLRKDSRTYISLICHSLGADLVADVILRIKYPFHRIVLLGAICKTRKGQILDRSCETLLNDRGSRDRYTILAGFMPWFYEASGTFGFRSGFADDGRSPFKNDHDSCAESDHIDKAVIPRLLSKAMLENELYEECQFSFVAFNWLRSLFWILIGVAFVAGIYAWHTNLYRYVFGGLFVLICALLIPTYYWRRRFD